AALTGADVGEVDHTRVDAANRRLAAALAARFERDMAARFESPGAAAAAVRVGEVRIVVRRWSG
ncbi:MAG: hypothetical protein A07HB70_00137, partial [uncultured archaeon A07HB70]